MHTFVRRPIANTVSEADRMIEAAQARDLKLAVGHNYRTFPGNRALKRLIDDGALERFTACCGCGLKRGQRCITTGIYGGVPGARRGWGADESDESRSDLLCWMVGDPVAVSAMMCNWGHRVEIEDTVVANIRFACGAHANVQ